MSSDTQEIPAERPLGKNTWYAKKTPRLAITPTTAALMAVRGAVKRKLPWVDSMIGAPIRINKKDGKKVNHVTSMAAKAPAKNKLSGPKTAFT